MGVDQLHHFSNYYLTSEMNINNNTQGDDDITKVDADGNTELHKAALDNKP